MIKAKRRKRYTEFPLKANIATSLILGLVFLRANSGGTYILSK